MNTTDDGNDIRRKIKVLIAEDDDDHAEILRFGLSRSKMCKDVERVSDGKQLIDHLRDSKRERNSFPDIVLLDLKMPKMGGLEALALIKTDPELMTVPIIILSTSNAPHDREQAYESHANSYLVKPTDFGTYRNMINDLMLFWSQWNVYPPPPSLNSTTEDLEETS